MCTVRSTLLIKRQEPLRRYWTNISCFGGNVGKCMIGSGQVVNQAGYRNNGNNSRAISRFYRGKCEVSVNKVFTACTVTFFIQVNLNSFSRGNYLY